MRVGSPYDARLTHKKPRFAVKDPVMELLGLYALSRARFYLSLSEKSYRKATEARSFITSRSAYSDGQGHKSRGSRRFHLFNTTDLIQ